MVESWHLPSYVYENRSTVVFWGKSWLRSQILPQLSSLSLNFSKTMLVLSPVLPGPNGNEYALNCQCVSVLCRDDQKCSVGRGSVNGEFPEDRSLFLGDLNFVFKRKVMRNLWKVLFWLLQWWLLLSCSLGPTNSSRLGAREMQPEESHNCSYRGGAAENCSSCSLNKSPQTFVTPNDGASLEQLVLFSNLSLSNYVIEAASFHHVSVLQKFGGLLMASAQTLHCTFCELLSPWVLTCLLLVSLWLVTPPPYHLIVLYVSRKISSVFSE